MLLPELTAATGGRTVHDGLLEQICLRLSNSGNGIALLIVEDLSPPSSAHQEEIGWQTRALQ